MRRLVLPFGHLIQRKYLQYIRQNKPLPNADVVAPTARTHRFAPGRFPGGSPELYENVFSEPKSLLVNISFEFIDELVMVAYLLTVLAVSRYRM